MKKTGFYSKIYFQKRDALPLHFAQTLRLFLKELKVKKVLDIGCGTGRLVKFLNQSGFQTTGCDHSNEAIKISGQVKAPATKLPFGANSFDCITAISLIEHLQPKRAKKFLKEVRRVLKPKGYLFIVTPNFASPMRLIKNKNWFGYLDPTHVTFYSPCSLKTLLQEHNFDHFRFRFKVNPKIPADWPFSLPPLPQNFHFLINYLLISSPLAYFRDSFWVLCQKKHNENWDFN